MRSPLFLFLVCVCVWCLALVHSQCINDTLAFQYQNAGVPCNTQIGSLVTKCKNFLTCRLADPNVTDPTPSCVLSTETYYADYPYGQYCVTDDDCVTPQYCSASSICDYRHLPNGYSCERDSQCASLHCLIEGTNVWGECDVSDSDFDSNGLVECRSDSECESEQFCSIKGECLPSLAPGDNCTFYSDSVNSANYVCKTGYACLPTSEYDYSCLPLFQAKYESYCGGSPYVCGNTLYCDSLTDTCKYYATYDGKDQDCESARVGKCPYGFKCSCAGETFDVNETASGVCTKYYNSFCSLSLTSYLTCLSDNHCPFDPFTIVGNPLSAFPSPFVGPLNRFSCAATHCTQKYNAVVKCQNDGFKYDNHFSPAFIPTWSQAQDATMKGWEVALIACGALTGAVIVAAAIVLVRGKATYEEI